MRAAALAAVLLVAMAGCGGASSGPRASAGPNAPGATTTASPTATAAPSPSSGAVGSCQLRGALPDPACTPGALDARVNPADIGSTICVAGWSTRVRPPESVTEPIKRERMRAYAMALPLSTVELDHLVPISLGGATSTANLWPEPLDGPEGAYMKDKLEYRLHALVCSGQVPLGEAQQAIARDWVTAYQRYVGPID